MAYSTIDDPTQHFNTVLYTGDGNSSRAITGVGHQPDFVWIKRRDADDSHMLYDSVRFDGSNAYWLQSNASSAEGSDRPLTAFGSDGFTIGSNNSTVNGNTNTYVCWNWKAGGSASSNSDGTGITSSVSANTTAGFSIVSYNGSGTTSNTVGHGLGTIDMLIVKSRDESDSWFVKHKDLSSNHNFNLDQTVAETNVTSAYSEGGLKDLSGNAFGFLDGTSDANAVNESSEKHIAYCFKSVKGYSKFGSYIGNGSTNGTFIYLGFRPAFVIVKRQSGGSESFYLTDNKRSTFNKVSKHLFPNTNADESDLTNDNQVNWDFTANGFKHRSTDTGNNNSGTSYIYMAFAESPFVNSNKVPTNAR